MSDQQKRDLVLPPGSYAYMQDVTKGVVKTYTGPTVINPTAQERPVVYNSGTFRSATSLEDAMNISPLAAEGYYIVLRNPAKANKHPDEGSAQPSAELEIGRTIVVPGPATFALWPAQSADVVEGHHLRSNQYLLVRVYNEDEARRNWSKAVVKPASVEGEATPLPVSTAPADLTVGKLLIIKGTDVSFYIPPTGIEVVSLGDDARNNGGREYVRDALTLERLEYSILVDENGKKRYEIGPQVVFPLPTERFVESRDDNGRPSKKFRAVELNEIQGLHIKVIADYEEDGKQYHAGDELFITGKNTSIYFPREEHSAVKYDGKTKHFATAIPAGEGRYVMNRLTGEITTVKGPAMLLPDPRHEVIVRRVLSDRECTLWYPGNAEALMYNQGIRALLRSAPTTRSGALSEGEYERGVTKSKGGSAQISTRGLIGASNSVMESSRVSGEQALAGEEFSRASTYTEPRMITLDTKFNGALQISPWTGYAVLVTSKTGGRRVEVGPMTVLLNYDEGIETLSLSTGKPKNTDKLFETPYLRVENNQVTDVFEVETSDHVKAQVRLSYRVNFEGDPLKWFSVENYVKFLCDHVRSVMKGAVRKRKVEEFYATATDVIRETILGKSSENGRQGMLFKENGMRVVDVEVLNVTLNDEKIRGLLDKAQHDTVQSNIDLSSARRILDVLKQKEEIDREADASKAETIKLRHTHQIALAASELEVVLSKAANDLRKISEDANVTKLRSEITDFEHEAGLERSRKTFEQNHTFAVAEQEKRLQLLRAEAESVVTRLGAAQSGFSEALLALSRNETLVQVAKAWDIQRVMAGESLADTLSRVFEGTPLKPLIEKLTTGVPANGAGKTIQPIA
jgi:major vault protein